MNNDIILLDELPKLYRDLNVWDKMYIKLRSKLCSFESIVNYIPVRGNIIDVGCGYGILSNLLAYNAKERNVIGVDLSEKRISIARKSIGQRTNIAFNVKDACELEFKGYDAVIMVELLHHLPLLKQNKLLTNIYQQIDNGAILLILEVDKKPLWCYLLTVSIDIILNIGRPLCFHSSFEFRKILNDVGFNVEVITFQEKLFLSETLFICKKR